MSSMNSSATYRSRYSSSYQQNPRGDPSFDQMIDSSHGLFGEDGDRAPLRHSFGRQRESFGYTAPVSVRPANLGNVRTVGDTYQVTADVSQFQPQDIIVTTYNYHVVIHAEKVAENGTVSNTFTHKYQLPEDMDPLSVSCALNDAGTLVITAKKRPTTKVAEPAQPVYKSEIRL
ncbi:heat shock protein beta-7-like [Protopterus annectens]|uniref:heat shock protein beta-7-like n=1 Tax=Protopterus annectens TaxID=7888 RepID=UPI001CF9E7AF|nr:heat shock protein beta-7-like [Protopterus annectens]